MKKIWKVRIDKITYGLIYPAFFGNMIYDVINIFLNRDKNLHFSKPDSLIIAALFILFVLVDYMHLNGDVNSIFDKPEYKSRYYFFCDILTPVFLFTSFVFLRTQDYFEIGIIILSLVPGVIFVYKRSNPKSREYFIRYAIVSFILGLIIAFVFPKEYKTQICIEIFIIANILAYGFYTLGYYPKKSKEFDLNYVKTLRGKYPEKD